MLSAKVFWHSTLTSGWDHTGLLPKPTRSITILGRPTGSRNISPHSIRRTMNFLRLLLAILLLNLRGSLEKVKVFQLKAYVGRLSILMFGRPGAGLVLLKY